MRWIVSLIALALAGLGLYWAVGQWRYQRAIAHDDYAAASQLWPENPDPWRQLAEDEMPINSGEALNAAQIAVSDDSADWRNWAALSEMQFFTHDGDWKASIATMANRTRSYEAHWRYANLLLLTGDAPGFWAQSETTMAQTPSDYLDPILQQCLAAANNDVAQFNRALTRAQAQASDPDQPPVLAEAGLRFLLGQGRFSDAAGWWQELVQESSRLMHEDSTWRDRLATDGDQYVSQLAATNDAQSALRVWRDGVRSGIFAVSDGPTASNAVTNGSFATAFDSAPLNWDICIQCGPLINRQPGTDNSPGINIEFSGQDLTQPVLASQVLVLQPASTYRLQATARPGFAIPDGEGGDSGVAVLAVCDRVPLAQLSVPETGTATATSAATWQTPADSGICQLQIYYARPAGHLPLRGSVWISGIKLQRTGDAPPSGAHSTAPRVQ